MERIRLGVAVSELGRARNRAGATLSGPSRAVLDAFCRGLSEATALTIVPYAAPRYDRLLKRLRLGEVELAWLPPVLALTALSAGAIPLAVPLRGETPWFWTALFVRADSPVRSLADLPSARVAWVDGESASGYLVMRAALRAEGVDPDRAFAAQGFEGSHEAVVRAVLADPRTVGSTFLHLNDSGGTLRAGWGEAKVRVLKRAGPIPSDVLAHAGSLAPEAAQAVRGALLQPPAPALATAANELFSAAGFAVTEPAHLAHLQALGRYLVRERIR